MKNLLRLIICIVLTCVCCSLLIAQSSDKGNEEANAKKQVTKTFVIKSRPKPDYPEEAKGREGVVIIKAIFRASGEIEINSAKVMPESLPEKIGGALTRKAIEAARKIKFTPAVKEGHPVSTYVVLEYHFDPN